MRINDIIKVIVLFSVIAVACNKPAPMEKVIEKSLAVAEKQYIQMAEVMKQKPDLLPRTLDTAGNLVTAKSNWWTAGFSLEHCGICMSIQVMKNSRIMPGR